MTYQDIQDLQMLLDKDIKGVIAQGDITPKDYQCLDVAIDISKDLCEIAEKLEIMEDKVYGNSYGPNYDGGWNNNRGGNSGMYYDDNIHGNSFQSNNMRNRGGGNRGGRSGHSQISEKLEMMMQNANTEQERQVIQKLMNEMNK